MAVPTITPPESPRLIPKGVAFSLQLSASGTPTSWAMSSGPTGLSISSGGLISGTPTVGNTVSSASITATNGDGTSAAVTLIFVVTETVAGLAQGSLALPIDFDLVSGNLSIPGIETGQAEWKTDQVFPISLGLLNTGVLQEVTGIDRIEVTLKSEEEAPGVELTLDASAVTLTGGNTTARYETRISLPADGTVAAWFGDGAQSAAALSFPGLLEIAVQKYDDARDYEGADTEAVGNLTAGQTVNDTLFVALDEQLTSASYELALEFLSPTDTALQGNLSIATVAVAWTGSAFSPTGTLPGAITRAATGAEDWGVTLSIQSLSGNATGISASVRVVADAAISYYGAPIFADAAGGGYLAVNANETISISFGNYITIEWLNGATSLNVITLEDGDTFADVEAKFAAELGTNADQVLFFPDDDIIYFVFDPSYTADTTIYNSGGSYNNVGGTSFSQVTLTDCSWRLTITGLANADSETTRISRTYPLTITRQLSTLT